VATTRPSGKEREWGSWDLTGAMLGAVPTQTRLHMEFPKGWAYRHVPLL